MKSPDEIKKGLECCAASYADCHKECPYKLDCDGSQILKDALALIQQLQAENAEQAENIKWMEAERDDLKRTIRQLEEERDAMKEALGLMVYQYCVSGTELDHRYMCAGETAFRVLGLEQYGDTRTLESWLFPEYQEPEA